MKFDYFTKDNIENLEFEYFKIYKIFFTEKYNFLNVDEKLIYSLFLNICEEKENNNISFKFIDFEEKFNIDSELVRKTINKLDKNNDLIIKTIDDNCVEFELVKLSEVLSDEF